MSVNTGNKIVSIYNQRTIFSEESQEDRIERLLQEAIQNTEETRHEVNIVFEEVRQVTNEIHDEAELQRNYRIHTNQENARTTDFCKKAIVIGAIASSYIVGAHFGVVPDLPLHF